MITEQHVGCEELCMILLLLILGLIAFFSGFLILAIICWCSIPGVVIAFYIIRKKRWGIIKK